MSGQLRHEDESQSIYLIPPSSCIYTREQRNLSFLLEGEGGEKERGRVKEVDQHAIRGDKRRGEERWKVRARGGREDRRRRRENKPDRGNVIREEAAGASR